MKPKIICHIMSSVDGRLIDSRWTAPYKAEHRELLQVYSAIGREFGIRSISVQGGGILNGALLADKLIDELSLVIYPGIDGLSGVPSIFEYIGGKTEHPYL